jgi:hypothetical protein
MTSRIYPIFVPDESINEDNFTYSEVINWCYNNLSHPNVLVLTQDDLHFIQYQTIILDIINKENGSMLHEGEDDWIVSKDVKERLRNRLFVLEKNSGKKREKEILSSLLQLLDVSIISNKNLYFLF